MDFRQRCAYCERTESYLRGEEFFVIDHFRPRSRFPELLTQYSNLYYSCVTCNRYKSGAWPSTKELLEGLRFSDPSEEDMYVVHLRDTVSGSLQILTNCGRYTCAHIRLDRPNLVNWRLAKRAALEDVSVFESALKDLELLASAEADYLRREQVLQALAVLRRRIEIDREQFSSPSATYIKQNRRKHGVGFAEASTVFDDPLSITIPDLVHAANEERFVIIGTSSERSLLVVVHTVIGERIRLISARPATKHERRNYEEISF